MTGWLRAAAVTLALVGLTVGIGSARAARADGSVIALIDDSGAAPDLAVVAAIQLAPPAPIAVAADFRGPPPVVVRVARVLETAPKTSPPGDRLTAVVAIHC